MPWSPTRERVMLKVTSSAVFLTGRVRKFGRRVVVPVVLKLSLVLVNRCLVAVCRT